MSIRASAFDALRVRYPTWQAVLDAPVAELAETIRSGGLASRRPLASTGFAGFLQTAVN